MRLAPQPPLHQARRRDPPISPRPPPGETLLDWSVFYVARPAEYALAHLPQYHALEFGRSAYFLLREPALGQCSLTYFVNEARGHWAEERWEGDAAAAPQPGARQGAQPGLRPPARPNVAYKVVRPRDGGIALGLLCLEAPHPRAMPTHPSPCPHAPILPHALTLPQPLLRDTPLSC